MTEFEFIETPLRSMAMQPTIITSDYTGRRNRGRVEQLTKAVAAAIVEAGLFVTAVYLHGSWASEYERDDSDLDLAILTDHRLELNERVLFQQHIAAELQLDSEIDLADLYSANTVFAALVITSGERIYSAGRDADVFEMKTLASYARLNEERQEILQNIAQRGSVYASEMTGTI
ncbi:MAG: nucleotidyltransferase domain-containing protein [Gallionella sp.]|jgi:predicted nucleotidyltransferase|nr:nucleotidyltransferase domain-containing protein [Gallionella sp.]